MNNLHYEVSNGPHFHEKRVCNYITILADAKVESINTRTGLNSRGFGVTWFQGPPAISRIAEDVGQTAFEDRRGAEVDLSTEESYVKEMDGVRVCVCK